MTLLLFSYSTKFLSLDTVLAEVLRAAISLPIRV